MNNRCMPACPGATGCEYTTVFTDYECLTLQHRILPCQVWARGLGQGSGPGIIALAKSCSNFVTGGCSNEQKTNL